MFISSLIPAIIMIAPLLVIVYGLLFFKKRRAVKRRSPLSGELLRSPGESLRAEIEDVNFDLAAFLAFAPTVPLLLYSTYLSVLHFGPPKNGGLVTIAIYGFTGLAGLIYLTSKIWRLAHRRNQLSLGYEAELAVAQELNLMAHDGYWIFHDFPAQGFNIDHVVVGPAGVFAVETKGRAKPFNEDGKVEWTVEYDGTNLLFPGWKETEPIQQAIRQAKWLQDWLTNAVGESVTVKPILALPGWYVKRTGGGGIVAFNGKNAAALLGRISDNQLTEKLITQIRHQLDQKCRTVKPKAYSGEQGK